MLFIRCERVVLEIFCRCVAAGALGTARPILSAIAMDIAYKA